MKKLFLIVLTAFVAVFGVSCKEAVEELELLEKEINDQLSELDLIKEELDEQISEVELVEKEADEQLSEVGLVKEEIDEQISEVELVEKEVNEQLSEITLVTDAIEAETEAFNDLMSGETDTVTVTDASEIPSTEEFTLDIDGTYTTAEDVSLYIYLYDELPNNFITKSEARELGWSGGGLEEYAPGMCIGGDYFGNREGLLPKAKGRTYTECDINTLGEDSRGAERIVFSNDGLIYYTDDHYESFVLLYDEDGKAA